MVTLQEADRLLNELNGDLELLKKNDERDKKVIKTSMIGIFANVFLAVFKAVVGLMSNSFDVVISFDAPDRSKVFKEVYQQVSALYPDYVIYLAMDSDFSES